MKATDYHKLYAHPHDGVTDIYRDKGKKIFFARDAYHQYRVSKVRTFNCWKYFVEIIRISKG